MNDQEACATGSFQIIGDRRRILSASTILARIMTALDHASAWRRSQVFDVINARGFDEEPTAGDILAVCVILELPAGVLLGAVRDDLRGVDDVAGGYTDRVGDLH